MRLTKNAAPCLALAAVSATPRRVTRAGTTPPNLDGDTR